MFTSKTDKSEIVEVASRMEKAIKAGAMQAPYQTDVTVDIGNGEFIVVFNDSGTADYSMSIALNGKSLQYGDDYGLSGNEDYEKPETYLLPPDPLDLLDPEASKLIEAFCARHQ